MFGYSGGAILPVYDAVFRYNREHPRADGGEPLPLIVPANEQGAGFMAAGLRARVGQGRCRGGDIGSWRDEHGDAGARCMADSIPIVVICGQVPTAAIGTDAFQEAPISSIMASLRQARVPGHRGGAARSDAAHRVRDRAQRAARAGRRRHSEGRPERRADCSMAQCTLPMPGYRARLRRDSTAHRSIARNARASSSAWRARSVR